MARRTLRWERHLALRGLPHAARLGCGLRQLALWLVDNLFLGRLCIACTRWTVANDWHWGWHELADCTRTMPLPLGPLPPPPGPLNAKHCKRAQGAVFNGTHSPVRSVPSSPPPGSPQRDGGHPAIAPGAVLHARSRRVTTRFCAVGAKLRAVPLAKSPRAEWVGSQKFDSRSLHSLGQLPMRADESESVRSRFAT